MVAHERQILVVSGLAGSGKSVAIRALEDAGWYCIDNLPCVLMEPFVAEMLQSLAPQTHIALALDSRDPSLPLSFPSLKERLDTTAKTDVLFLEAREDVLVKRFRETRRLHPLTYCGSTAQDPKDLLEAIRTDRNLLAKIRPLASRIIDTSSLSTNTLRQLVIQMAGLREGHRNLLVKIMSFGFKYGVPADSDMVLDVRCFPNPHYDLALRSYTGKNPAVRQFVFQDPYVAEFIEKIFNLILFLNPLYTKEGKHYFGIAIGCTGGKHRSVAIAEELMERLKPKIPYLALEHCHLDCE